MEVPSEPGLRARAPGAAQRIHMDIQFLFVQWYLGSVSIRSFVQCGFGVQVATAADSFVDLADVATAATVAAVRAAELDVLIDYDGFHDFNNAELLAARAAPLQCGWIGFPGSTGSNSHGRHGHSTLSLLRDLHSNLAVIAVIFCRNGSTAHG
jgi:hypothetical protein